MAIENGSDIGGDAGIDANSDGNPFDSNKLDDGHASIADNPPIGNSGGATNPASFVKRGRGRPRRDSTTGGNPNAGTDGEKNEGKERGKSRAGVDLNIDLFATQIVGAHKLLALVLKQPMLVIDEKEAKRLATAIKSVMALHSININPSTLAYLQLLGVCIAIYGPRIAFIVATQKKERENTVDGQFREV